MIKIEKGVPIPRSLREAAPCPYPFDGMEIGDSFAVPHEGDRKGAAQRVRMFALRRARNGEPFAIAVREEKGGTIRVWRIEPKPKIPREKGAKYGQGVPGGELRENPHEVAQAQRPAPISAAATPGANGSRGELPRHIADGARPKARAEGAGGRVVKGTRY